MSKKKMYKCPYCHKLIDCDDMITEKEEPKKVTQEDEEDDIVVLNSNGEFTMDDWFNI